MALAAAQDNRKLRVMIVEDELDTCMALKIILKGNFPCDEIFMTANGEEAWETLQREPVDLIISDWNMPRMSGDRLLELVRGNAKTQKTPFLMLTVRKDPESVTTAIKAGVNGYVIKPFGQNTIISKVESMIGIKHSTQHGEQDKPGSGSQKVSRDTVFSKLTRAIERGDFVLPALPHLIVKIEDALVNPASNTDSLAGLIEIDSAVAAKIIAVSNSPFYKGTNKCANVREALIRIGLQEARQLVFIISSKSLFTTRDKRFVDLVEQLFMHSVAVGAASQHIARQLRLGDPHEYFLFGLLHDIGKLAVIQILSDIIPDPAELSYESIMEAMDSMHTGIGRTMLDKWRFGPVFCEVALKHEEVSAYDKPGKELSVVHFCNILVRELGFSLKENVEKDMLKHITSRHLLGMNADMIEAASEDVRQYVAKVKSMV